MRVYLQENVKENELGLIAFKKGEMKYLCLFDASLNVHGVQGYESIDDFYDLRVIEAKRGVGMYMLEVTFNKIYPSWFTFDREVNINDHGFKTIRSIYKKNNIKVKKIPKKSKWYRPYGNKEKEFYVNHFFRLKKKTIDLEKLKEIGNKIILKQNLFKERIEVIQHLYKQALDGKIRN